MTIKRVTALLLALLTLIPALCVGVNAQSGDFADVPASHWAYKGVGFMREKGYMAGTGENYFSPGTAMTRAMFVTTLAAMAGAECDNNASSRFSDVPSGQWYTGAVIWATENGIVAGTGGGNFSPDANVTREQTAVMLRSFGVFLDRDVSYEDETLLSLCYDASSVASYAIGAVRWALNYGLMSNLGDMDFAPKKALTRAEAALILCNFSGYEDIPPIVPPKTHTVKFVDRDGKLLYTSTVADGKTPKYRGNTPTLPDAGNTRYVFSGWYPQTGNIYADTTYTATYDVIQLHTVTYVNWDGSVLFATKVPHGETTWYQGGETPKRPSTYEYAFTFLGWDGSAINVTTDLTITAQYSKIKIAAPSYDIRNDKFIRGGITINNSSFKMSQNLLNRLNNAVTSCGDVTVGFYVVDLQSKMTLGYNADMSFRTACTVKAGYALYAYKTIESGRASFNDTWVYQPKHYVDRSGTIQFSPFGTKYKAEYVLYNMINISDNVAYYMAQDYLGYQGYNDMVTSLGVQHTHWAYNSWGYLTPHELGLIWQEIYRYRYQSAYGEKLFNIFLNAKFNFIKQGLGGKYQVAHKSGWNDYVYNDAGVVFAKRPYVMVILTTPGHDSTGGNQSCISKISKLLDEYMSEYTAWYDSLK